MSPKVSPPVAPTDFKWSATLRETGQVLVIALVITAISWFVRSDGLPLVADPVSYELELAAPLAGIQEALTWYDEGDYFFVDTRSRTGEDYQTIPGAFLIQESSFDDDILAYFDFMTPEDHFILFGDGNLFQVSNIATRMKDRGYLNLFILKGGLSAWRHAGGEISQRTGGAS